jgi:outer membrane receptor protein involved in Fe transport
MYYGSIRTVDRQTAVYGQVSYAVTNRLELSAGLRFFDWHEDYSIYSSGYVGDSPSASPEDPIGTPQIIHSSPSATGTTPRFAANYRLNDETNLFAEVAEGFRYGGVNQPVPTLYCGADLAANGLTSAPPSFGPDKLWSYTVGEKSRLADDRVTLNLTGFWINWKNTQTTVPLNCTYFYTENVGSVTSKGVEIETAAKLSRYATVSFNGSYNHSAASADISNLNAPAGTTSPYAPRFIASVIGSYTVPVGNDSFELIANYSFKSSFYNEFDHTSSDLREIPSTKTLNAALSFLRGRYEISVFGNNLTNAVNIEQISAETSGSLGPGDDVAYDRPRTIGLRLRASF